MEPSRGHSADLGWVMEPVLMAPTCNIAVKITVDLYAYKQFGMEELLEDIPDTSRSLTLQGGKPLGEADTGALGGFLLNQVVSSSILFKIYFFV